MSDNNANGTGSKTPEQIEAEIAAQREPDGS